MKKIAIAVSVLYKLFRSEGQKESAEFLMPSAVIQ